MGSGASRPSDKRHAQNTGHDGTNSPDHQQQQQQNPPDPHTHPGHSNPTRPSFKSDDDMSENSFQYSSPSVALDSVGNLIYTSTSSGNANAQQHSGNASRIHSDNNSPNESDTSIHNADNNIGGDENGAGDGDAGNGGGGGDNTTSSISAAIRSGLRWRVGINTTPKRPSVGNSTSIISTVMSDPTHETHRNSKTNANRNAMSDDGIIHNAAPGEAQLLRHIRHIEEECNKAQADKRRFAEMLSNAEVVIAERYETIKTLEDTISKMSEEMEEMKLMLLELSARETCIHCSVEN